MFKRGSIIVILIVLAAAALWYWRASRDDEAPQISTVSLSRGDVTQSVTATGIIQPVTSVEVSSQISGLISEVLVDYNTPVKEGQILARIDPATYQQLLLQARAALASSVANLHLVELNSKRTQELFEKHFMTQQDVDTAAAQVEQAKADVQTKEANVEAAKVNLDRCTITSPITGIVMARETDPGKTVAASFNAPTLFIIANQLTDMEIDASVAEADIGNVRQNQPVEFNVDAYPSRKFFGKVIQVRANPTTTNNVVTYDTMIAVKNNDLKLMSGMTADVSIIVARHHNVLRIPNSALRARVPEELVTVRAKSPAGAPEAKESSLSPEERRRLIWETMRDVGISRGTPPTPEQIKEIQTRLKAKGINFDPSRFGGREGGREGSGSPTTTTERTVYVLLPSPNPVKPRIEAVQVKLGITDGIYTEVLSGLKESDQVITSAIAPTSRGSNTSNPFGGPRFGHH